MSTLFPSGWMALQGSMSIAFPSAAGIMSPLGLENYVEDTISIITNTNADLDNKLENTLYSAQCLLCYLYHKSLLYSLEYKWGLFRALLIDNIRHLKGIYKLFE